MLNKETSSLTHDVACDVCEGVPAVVFRLLLPSGGGPHRFLSFSRDIECYTEKTPQALVADQGLFWRCIHPDDREAFAALLEDSLSAGEYLEAECRLGNETHDDVRWVSLRMRPEPQPDGDVLWLGLIGDATRRKRLERKLEEEQVRFTNVARNIPGAVFRYLLYPDGTDKLEYMSEGCSQLYEIAAEDVIKDVSLLWNCIDPADVPAIAASVRQSAETLTPWRQKWRITTPSGIRKWVESVGQPKRLEGGVVVWDTVTVDVSERAAAEERSRELENRYRLLAENTFDLVLIVTEESVVEYASPACLKLLGSSPATLLGKAILDRVLPDDRQLAELGWFPQDISDSPMEAIVRLQCEDGETAWFESHARRLDDDGEDPRWLLSLRDVSDRVSMERQLLHEATHDPLTGLPNRALLEERLRVALCRRDRHPQDVFAVVFMDLDRFKVINDSLGHERGDALLQRVAKILRASLRRTDLACRLGGDEFVVVLEELGGLDEALQVVNRVNARLAEPIELDDQSVTVKASMGIVLSDARYREPKELLRDADIAMYRAKRSTREFYALFDSEMHEQAIRHMRLETDLRRAVSAEQLEVYYQPIVELDGKRPVALEALVRWQHPELGFLLPGQFMALAVETGEIRAIDRFVLRRALLDLLDLQSRLGDNAPQYVAVNVSAMDLHEADFIEFLEKLLTETGAQPSALTLEVTESELIDDIEQAGRILRKLSDRGFGLSLDDFGTGYSSLTYLHQLPVHVLKADRSFVASAAEDGVARGILESLALLARNLAMPIVAEGVETEEEEALVLALGFPMAQGYRYGRPMPFEQLSDSFTGAALPIEDASDHKS
jgi:diguanylate cyclase (GGDEF)-like protein/PAS domain S-box-containing protein